MSGAEQLVGFGWVVDDGCKLKTTAGGPGQFAQALATGKLDSCDVVDCPTCRVLGENGGCVGTIEGPIGPDTEEWLAGRLPASLESLPGQLLRQNLKESAITGKGGESLRKRGLMAAPKPFTKHYGPFYKGYSVTTDQIFEEMLCAGDIQPSHALAILVHLGGISIDDVVPADADHGTKLAEVVKDTGDREDRVLCTIHIEDDDDASTIQIKRLLRALYAAFVQDTEIRVFGG